MTTPSRTFQLQLEFSLFLPPDFAQPEQQFQILAPHRMSRPTASAKQQAHFQGLPVWLCRPHVPDRSQHSLLFLTILAICDTTMAQQVANLGKEDKSNS